MCLDINFKNYFRFRSPLVDGSGFFIFSSNKACGILPSKSGEESGSEGEAMAKEKAEPKKAVVKLQDQEIQTNELATIVGKSARWIRQLTSEKVLVQTGRGKYILGIAVQSYIEYASGGKEDDGKPRFIDHKTEHERIKTEKASLELSRLRGELHRSEDVEQAMSDMLMAFRQKILGVPTKLAPQLVGIEEIPVIKARLTEMLHEALSELADYDPNMFQEDRARMDANAET
jgi:phage terminase Nu1 subunit (DNA packaging protein)